MWIFAKTPPCGPAGADIIKKNIKRKDTKLIFVWLVFCIIIIITCLPMPVYLLFIVCPEFLCLAPNCAPKNQINVFVPSVGRNLRDLSDILISNQFFQNDQVVKIRNLQRHFNTGGYRRCRCFSTECWRCFWCLRRLPFFSSTAVASQPSSSSALVAAPFLSAEAFFFRLSRKRTTCEFILKQTSTSCFRNHTFFVSNHLIEFLKFEKKKSSEWDFSF